MGTDSVEVKDCLYTFCIGMHYATMITKLLVGFVGEITQRMYFMIFSHSRSLRAKKGKGKEMKPTFLTTYRTGHG